MEEAKKAIEKLDVDKDGKVNEAQLDCFILIAFQVSYPEFILVMKYKK